jgi:hypothetical protein
VSEVGMGLSDTHKMALGGGSTSTCEHGVSSIHEVCCSPALMYLTCPATQTTKLRSGRPSTNRLRLRSYSEAGIPGVTSPCLTFFYARISDERSGVLVWAIHSPRWVWDFEVGWPNRDGLGGVAKCA